MMYIGSSAQCRNFQKECRGDDTHEPILIKNLEEVIKEREKLAKKQIENEKSKIIKEYEGQRRQLEIRKNKCLVELDALEPTLVYRRGSQGVYAKVKRKQWSELKCCQIYQVCKKKSLFDRSSEIKEIHKRLVNRVNYALKNQAEVIVIDEDEEEESMEKQAKRIRQLKDELMKQKAKQKFMLHYEQARNIHMNGQAPLRDKRKEDKQQMNDNILKERSKVSAQRLMRKESINEEQQKVGKSQLKKEQIKSSMQERIVEEKVQLREQKNDFANINVNSQNNIATQKELLSQQLYKIPKLMVIQVEQKQGQNDQRTQNIKNRLVSLNWKQKFQNGYLEKLNPSKAALKALKKTLKQAQNLNLQGSKHDRKFRVNVHENQEQPVSAPHNRQMSGYEQGQIKISPQKKQSHCEQIQFKGSQDEKFVYCENSKLKGNEKVEMDVHEQRISLEEQRLGNGVQEINQQQSVLTVMQQKALYSVNDAQQMEMQQRVLNDGIPRIQQLSGNCFPQEKIICSQQQVRISLQQRVTTQAQQDKNMGTQEENTGASSKNVAYITQKGQANFAQKDGTTKKIYQKAIEGFQQVESNNKNSQQSIVNQEQQKGSQQKLISEEQQRDILRMPIDDISQKAYKRNTLQNFSKICNREIDRLHLQKMPTDYKGQIKYQEHQMRDHVDAVKMGQMPDTQLNKLQEIQLKQPKVKTEYERAEELDQIENTKQNCFYMSFKSSVRNDASNQKEDIKKPQNDRSEIYQPIHSQGDQHPQHPHTQNKKVFKKQQIMQ